MASDMVTASILILEECQQAAMLAAGEDGVHALFPSVLRGTAWKSLVCCEQRALQDSEMIAGLFSLLCSSPSSLEDMICYPIVRNGAFKFY